MKIWNDGTGNEEIGNYNFIVLKDGKRGYWNTEGKVRSYKRLKDDVWLLVRLCLDEMFKYK